MVSRAKILAWLVTVNPSYNHNQALDLHQNGTCEWVLSTAGWNKWTEDTEGGVGGSRGIWIHGIPGAGKTILASFLAGNMTNLAEKTSLEGEATLPKIAVYYYCHHARNHDEMGHFLAWLLSQLCRKAEDIPESICNLFKRDCRSHLDHLIEAIKLVATRFSSILISIDAVDESQRRETLAGFVKRLATDNEFGRFHFVVTSRKETERHLSGFVCLSMSNPLVDRDIRTYIDDQPETDRALKWFSTKLRIVICQLQILRKMSLESAVWKAVDQLPETLDETYERILVAIPVDDFQSEMTEDEPSEEAFQEIMNCLITVEIPETPKTCSCSPHCLVPPQTGHMNQHEQHAWFAHYTIKEYVKSSRLGRNQASLYFFPSSQALAHSIKVMFKAQVSSNGHHHAPWQDFKHYCGSQWPRLLEIADTVITSDQKLTALVGEAHDPRKPCYRALIKRGASFNCLGPKRYALENEFLDRPDLSVLHNLIRRGLYATTTMILLRYTSEQVASLCMYRVECWEDIPMVGWLARDHFDKYLLLFLERCGTAFRYDNLIICAIEMYRAVSRTAVTVNTLISAKVPVNPENVRVTPPAASCLPTAGQRREDAARQRGRPQRRQLLRRMDLAEAQVVRGW
ncbi:hypothetical protein QQX98_009718 [Neonectria punicea]|uniref:Nephrocystin 3-like N-terminal domain-containing protein n=1 Tax=Neonectria punicea TaxID=979145 RepID=A0ABR1GRI7_9HYPO